MIVKVEKADWHLLVLVHPVIVVKLRAHILDRTPHVYLRLGEALL